MNSALLSGLLFSILIAPVGSRQSAQNVTGRPPTQPILRIEAGGHFGSVRSPVVDPKGRFLITISDQDKTVRVWRLPDLQLIRVIRPPVGIEADWSNWAAALSPDGATLAVWRYRRAVGS